MNGMPTRSSLFLALVVLSGCSHVNDPITGPSTATPDPYVVVNASGQLDKGLDLFVDTDTQQRAWLTITSDGLQAAFPSNQAWGFIGAVVLGSTTLGSRPWRDVSKFKTLQIDLKGKAGGEVVQIGIKDNLDPDDGTEDKKNEVLSSDWRTFTYPLADFHSADLTRVYLLFEVVFNGSQGRTVFVRNVKYVP